MRELDQAPSVKDLDMAKRFREFKNFNEGRNNDDDDMMIIIIIIIII